MITTNTCSRHIFKAIHTPSVTPLKWTCKSRTEIPLYVLHQPSRHRHKDQTRLIVIESPRAREYRVNCTMTTTTQKRWTWLPRMLCRELRIMQIILNGLESRPLRKAFGIILVETFTMRKIQFRETKPHKKQSTVIVSRFSQSAINCYDTKRSGSKKIYKQLEFLLRSA